MIKTHPRYEMMARISKGLFMEARVLPVLVWAFTAVLTGTALAYLETGLFNSWGFFLTMMVACLAQAFPIHAINELVDWSSGTDATGLGGSKVIREGYLSKREMKILFWISLIGIFALAALGILTIDNRPIPLFVVGMGAGLFYSLKPFKFAYRPFLGEWASAFVGIMVCVTGAYFVQVGTLSTPIIILAAAISFEDMAIMILFHTIDYENDKAAMPVKKTTVVFLGQELAKYYVLLLAGMSIVFYLFLMIFYHPVFSVFSVLTLASYSWFVTYDPFNPHSIIRSTRVITWSAILSGLIFAVIINAKFGVMIVPVVILYWMHKNFGKIKKTKEPSAFEETIEGLKDAERKMILVETNS
ncbi:MAG: prenyltransferase [Candidatus Heimdallarchaeota archaeon]